MASKVIKDINDFVDKNIQNENLEKIVGDRFGRYSKYIIQDRALPDVRDGLKPVQRRILFSMYKLGMFSNKPFKKSARIVGDVIGKYHPHGDTSVYNAMVRLSQYWKTSNLLVDMHGNKGSIDGDSPAAMRYTEARMSKTSEMLLKDIEFQTVDFIPNFDDEEYEPTVLPARIPNLLLNGATGISAGYATEIPPHNTDEIITAVIKRLKNPKMELDALLEIVKGPDFPTGAIVQGKKQIKKAFETGRGRIKIKSKATIDDQLIIVTEIPYEVNKANLVRKIDDIRLKKKIDGIDYVRDESDRTGLRIVVKVSKDFDPVAILKFLHRKTNLTKTYNYNMVAIDNKRPKLMSLFEILDAYILHQKEVITNRSNFKLRKAKKRLHIVDGIIRLMEVIDQVIALIRISKNKKQAKSKIKQEFDFSEEQAEAIVTLQLYRLSSTDIKALESEKSALNKEIDQLNKILNTELELEKVIIKELRKFQKQLDTTRRSEIEEEIETFKVAEEKLISEEHVVVGITKEGYIKAASKRSHSATESTMLKENDSFLFEDVVSNLDTMLIFTNLGNYIYLPVYKIPRYKWKELGTHINNIVELEQEEKIIKIIQVSDFEADKTLLFVTKDNLIKQTKLKDFDVARYTRPIKAIQLDEGNEVVSIDITKEHNGELLIISKRGKALRFNAEDISITSTIAKGMKAQNMSPRDELTVGLYLKDFHDLLLLTNRGTIKRMSLSDIEKKKRTNKGVQLYKVVKSNPYYVVDASLLNETQYKDRASVVVTTTNTAVKFNAFKFKTDTTENGRTFIKKKAGTPRFINLEQLEENPDYPPLSAYTRQDDKEDIQQKLFD
ncbi:MAG: DNA topoisomerase IV subunit A [Candidatus Izimaplasma sp.]|nr:DNA topoisomerase IV subunit A [Candidatus Izimaplasma bacterium]